MIAHGDCVEVMRAMEAASLDSMVTDPPAGIAFMGKDWDKDKGGRAGWVAWMTGVMTEALRVLKPGAHALVWAIPRTQHWTATALEDAGFEIRDVVTHLFGTGFPKSLDVSKAIDKAAGEQRPRIAGGQGGNNSVLGTRKPGEAISGEAISGEAKQWQGWGTALKPACEMWILCRKPISEKTVAANVLKHGTGAVNVDGCRIGTESTRRPLGRQMGGGEYNGRSAGRESLDRIGGSDSGRFPANLILSHNPDCDDACTEGCAVAELDGQAGHLHGAGNRHSGPPASKTETSMFGIGGGGHPPDKIYDRGGSASRFFYCAKASKSDRGDGNTHPTVKSSKLMSYLCRLVTPPGGIILDPFAGSGSTGVAALAEGFRFVGIEQDEGYAGIATRRLYEVIGG